MSRRTTAGAAMGRARRATTRRGMAGGAMSWREGARARTGSSAAALLPFLLTAAAAAPASAQEPPAPPTLRVAVDTTTITVGGRVHLTVVVEHAVGATVQWPDSLNLAPFEALGAVVGPAAVADGRATTEAALTLTAFELGELEIPGFAVSVVSPGGVVELVTDPFGIAVVSVGLDEGAAIRDIRGPLSIPRSWLAIALWALALALAAAGGGYWLARRARRRGTDDASVSEAPPRPAHEIAHEALDWLESSALLRQGRVKEYYIEVSDIVRRYLEGRFAIRALEMTSREVLEQLVGVATGPGVHGRFASFLRRCDLVKFAKHRPGPAACGEIVPAARALVDATLPPPPAPVEGEEGEPDEGKRDEGAVAEGVAGWGDGTAPKGVATRDGDPKGSDARPRGRAGVGGRDPEAVPLAGAEKR